MSYLPDIDLVLKEHDIGKISKTVGSIMTVRENIWGASWENWIFACAKTKGTDQLCSNCIADQCLCFYYKDSRISLLLKSEISSF